MLIAKIVNNPNKPEFVIPIRIEDGWLLINKPPDKPYVKREAQWLRISAQRIEWIKEFF